MNLRKKLLIVCAIGFLNISACSMSDRAKTYGVPEKEWKQLTAEQKQDIIEKHHNRRQRRQLESDLYWKTEWEKRRTELKNGEIEWFDYQKTE